MSRSAKSRFYTALGWAVFTYAKRRARQKVTPSHAGRKLLIAGAVATLVGGAAYVATASEPDADATA